MENMNTSPADLAARLIALDPYQAQDTDTTPADVAEQISTDPAAVIAFLLDIIDELQA